MSRQFTLRRELLTAFALVFAGALLVAVLGVLVVVPRIESPLTALLYVLALVLGDLAVFSIFGRWLIHHRILRPLDGLVSGVEAIAEGRSEQPVEISETRELGRLAEAVNVMALRLITHQEQLAANVRSLQDTNRQLTDARNELVRSERMASVGRLAAGIAHEVGNPLGAVMGYLDLSKRSAEGRQRELLEAAESETRRIDRIVHGLLDFARPREVKGQRTDVSEVTQRTLDLVTDQGKLEDLEVSVELASGLPAVRADPYRLQQVLVNLVLNAVDAMEGVPERRLLVVTALARVEPPRRMPVKRREDPPGIDYSHRRRFHQRPQTLREPVFTKHRAVSISVEDTGSGIPAALLDQVFEPFVTTKEPGKGTGLGLAVAARLIDAMGGTITIRSEEGKGTAFTVLLPLAEDAAEVEAQQAGAREGGVRTAEAEETTAQ
ncbi:MAG TPA: ATP-binding protein [Longimicrobiales bacterium]|nr:ATP-binding protein [Longimicrobiales bacterium]